jgi:hypothetical protein
MTQIVRALDLVSTYDYPELESDVHPFLFVFFILFVARANSQIWTECLITNCPLKNSFTSMTIVFDPIACLLDPHDGLEEEAPPARISLY